MADATFCRHKWPTITLVLLHESLQQAMHGAVWVTNVAGIGSNRNNPVCLSISMIVRTSDIRCQEYTELQSLIKCLDHRDIVLVTVCGQTIQLS